MLSWWKNRSAVMKGIIAGVGAAILALIVGLVVLGVYTHIEQDHRNLHALINIQLQREQQASKPTAPPAP